jgi:hypothetical protein
MGRLTWTIAIGAVSLLSMAAPVMACEPYTFGNGGFRLDRGVAWAFAGRVLAAVPGEIEPLAMVIRVDRTIAGTATGDRRHTIERDAGCDGFWYGPGDDVVVALPRYPQGDVEVGPEDRIRPPYAHTSNNGVAVWVIRDGRVVARSAGPHSWARIGGRSPRTLEQLEAALRGLPDTSTATVPPIWCTGWLGLVPVAAGAAALVIALRWPRRPAPAISP